MSVSELITLAICAAMIATAAVFQVKTAKLIKRTREAQAQIFNRGPQKTGPADTQPAEDSAPVREVP